MHRLALQPSSVQLLLLSLADRLSAGLEEMRQLLANNNNTVWRCRDAIHPVGSWSRTQDTGRGLGAQDVDSSGACQPLSISRLVPFQFDYLLSSQMASLRFHGPATIQLSSICSVCFCAWPSCADDGDESVGLGPCRLFLSLPCTCRLYRLHIRCARPVYLLRPDSALLSPQSKPFLSTVKTTT